MFITAGPKQLGRHLPGRGLNELPALSTNPTSSMLFGHLEHLLLSASLTSQIITNPSPPSPTLVKLPYGSFEGKESGNLVEFLGIPFAAPPIGKLRFEPPTNSITFKGVRQATSFGPACPQLEPEIDLPLPRPANVSEDCLYLNVIKPTNIPEGQEIPVLFIHGGTLVNRSIDLGAPVILVSAAYRVNAFGFLGGKEVKAARLGNVGLRDQRFALQWVQNHIGKFGAIARKLRFDILSWGVSAGAMSVAMHMLLNDGNQDGLFRGGVMGSGSPMVLPDIVRQQRHFDTLVADTNCTDAIDRLECLRDAPYDALIAAVQRGSRAALFAGGRFPWQPMVDGNIVVRDPQLSVRMGKFSNIPVMTGCAEDEGTNNAEFLEFAKSNYFNKISDEDLKALEIAYPDDVTQGSPFNTGTAHVFSPQYKRLSAFQGDLVFQATRRSFSAIASKRQPVYGFRYMRVPSNGVPYLGVAHGSDLPEFMALVTDTGFIGADALIYFIHNGDPNAPQDSISLLRNTKWEVYSSSTENPPLFTFVDPPPSVNVTFDTYRTDAMKLLNKLSLKEIGRYGL
ncbi:hypothetical protein NLJ89_g5567 [Agrocybe chaxingu]|uniref:Carboxylesterase type B domain-containing protein n=1 Tax=Agrocybe chaxingu TaxID=84603 RepID=A0A9W8K102_9AGAR|nr:hypothetical protein NLJ89_g5567 [Agrocybe chaxingu]